MNAVQTNPSTCSRADVEVCSQLTLTANISNASAALRPAFETIHDGLQEQVQQR